MSGNRPHPIALKEIGLSLEAARALGHLRYLVREPAAYGLLSILEDSGSVSASDKGFDYLARPK